ncbi:MAG: Metalloendopeptidase [Parcubacteria group bacterium]|nr:Metalloendopeptidase [Parcubacteria group bacterium]
MQESKNIYDYPLLDYRTPEEGSEAHTGDLRYSIDWDCPEGTEIYAACTGTVVFVKDDSNEGGEKDEKYWYSGNRIVIEHENGEYSAYEHLRYRGVVVRVGEKVVQGQLIGYSGNTGYGDGPHLHFEVFIDPSEDRAEGKTVPVRFIGS